MITKDEIKQILASNQKDVENFKIIYASLWRFLLRCALFCRSAATFLTSVSSYEGGCGFEER